MRSPAPAKRTVWSPTMSPPRRDAQPMLPECGEPGAAARAFAVAVVGGVARKRLALRGGDDLAHAQRGAARCVDLHAVVDLKDLDVEAFGQRARRDIEQLQDDVDADAHVRRH